MLYGDKAKQTYLNMVKNNCYGCNTRICLRYKICHIFTESNEIYNIFTCKDIELATFGKRFSEVSLEILWKSSHRIAVVLI